MATSEYINVDAILNLKKVNVDKSLSDALDKILADAGTASVKELIKSFEKAGYSRAVATTKAREFATGKAMMADPDKKTRARGEDIVLRSAENATIQFAQKQLNIQDMLNRSFEGFLKAGETDDISEKKKLFSTAEKDYKAIRKLYESDELDASQKRMFRQATAARGIVEDEIGKKLDETNKLVKDSPKKEASEFKKVFGAKEFLAATDFVSAKKDTALPGAAWGSALNLATLMGGPRAQFAAAMAKTLTAIAQNSFRVAEKAFAGAALYGTKYSSAIAEQMAGSGTGFTEQHYEKMADTATMFQARAAFGEIGERQWTGMAFLPNYMNSVMRGASPEEQARALEADREMSPNDAFFRQYLNMANVPEEVLGWIKLNESEKQRIHHKRVIEAEIGRRAEAAWKVKGEPGGLSVVNTTSAQWSERGLTLGDWLRNPRLSSAKEFVAQPAINPFTGEYDESMEFFQGKARERIARQRTAAEYLNEGERSTTVNVTLEVDGATMFEGSQTQKEVLDSNYRFVGGAQ